METLLGTNGDDVLVGSDAPNLISGFDGNDTLMGNGAADWLEGDEGDDQLFGGEGNDRLFGGSGNDELAGGAGNDQLFGGSENDILVGAVGADQLEGNEGDDLLEGGADRDTLLGGAGTNVYRFNRGNALDTLTLTDGETAVIELGAGIALSDISVQQGSVYDYTAGGYLGLNRLVIGLGGNDAVLIEAPVGQALSSAQALSVRLQDGTVMSMQQLLSLSDAGEIGYQTVYGDAASVLGSQADDSISVYENSVSMLVDGRANNDDIRVEGAGALIAGGAGNDRLHGNAGSVMAGQGGNDELSGNYNGTPTFAFNAGDGKDRILAESRHGVISLGAGIQASQVRLRLDRATGDLVMSFAGLPDDEIRMQWYAPDLDSSQPLPVSRVQFINVAGRVTSYDLQALLQDPQFSPLALDATEQEPGLPVFALSQALQGAVAPQGGLAAVAYAQTGDLLGAVNVAANTDASQDNLIFGTPNADIIDAGAGHDVVMAGAGNDQIRGGSGNDHLDGEGGDDALFGDEGDDTLMGGQGNDVIYAGAGDDIALGGLGSDTYVFERGDGKLYVQDDFDESGGGFGGYGGYGGYGGAVDNVLSFGAGITSADLSFARRGDELVITVRGMPGDEITLAGYDQFRRTLTRSVDRLQFQNGEDLDAAVALENGQIHLLIAGDGPIQGTEYADVLTGGLGGDLLAGGASNDRLIGGWGDDAYLIDGDSDSDVIIDRAGEANTVIFSGSVRPEDLRLLVDLGVARIEFGNGSITLEGWEGQSLLDTTISNFVFADGSQLSMQALFEQGRSIRGTANADILIGTAGDDLIEGLQGNDAMQGGAGADTYVIHANSGQDTITDASTLQGRNVLQFANINDPSQVRLSVNAEGNLVVHTPDGSSVTLTNFNRLDALGSQRTIEFFQFGANIVSYEDLLARGFETQGTSSGDVLLGTNLRDTITGGAGDDIIESGTGGDTVGGGQGSDVYRYDSGDGFLTINDVADASGGNVLRFGAGITPETLERKLRFALSDDDQPSDNRFLIVFDENNQISIAGFDRSNPRDGFHGINAFEFADGTVLNWDELLDKVFVVEGGADNDALLGTSRSDRLYGYGGNDVLQAGQGDDVVTGGAGNDALQGGLGSDNYVFSIGDGVDTLRDGATASNIISFTGDISSNDLVVTRNAQGQVVINYGSLGDAITIETEGDAAAASVIEFIEFSDGSRLRLRDLLNAPPVIGTTLINQSGRVGDPLSFGLASGAFTDPDGDLLSLVAQLSTGQQLPAWLSFDAATGLFNGTPPVGTQADYEITVFAVDGSGDATSQSFVLQVIPRNSSPVVMDDAASLSEDGAALVTGNVLQNDSDADAADVLQISNSGIYLGEYGQLVLQANGSYTYSLNNASISVQSLRAGQQVADVFTLQTTDGIATVASSLTLNITGANDGPVVEADVAAVAEDGIVTAIGNVLANDRDTDVGDTLSISNAGTYQGSYGSLTLQANGSYSYQLNNSSSAVQSLRVGQQVQDIFALQTSDGIATAASNLTIIVTGSNDGPVAQGDVAAVSEDGIVSATGNVLINDSDVDSGTLLSIANAGQYVGQYGTLSLQATGSYSYALNNGSSAIQSLRAGQQVADVFTLQTTDGIATVASSLTLNIAGSNDAPIVQADIAIVSEGGIVSATGNVLTNDRDIDTGTVLSIVNAGTYQGTYGSLTLQANGSYSYSLNNSSSAVQSLAAGQQVQDSFQYAATDGQASTASQLIITITGSNDAPTLQTAIADQTAQATQVFTLDLPGTTFRDIDQGDVLAYNVLLSSGAALPTWLSFNPVGLIFTGTPPQTLAGQSLDIQITATDRAGASASDIFRISVDGITGLNLVGTCRNDRLVGGAGNDTIDGKEGSDTMLGGVGDDLYYVDEAASHCDPGDVVTEYLNQGYDRVVATVNYVLPQHVEALTLGGTSCIDGTGNNLDNWLSGNSASNTLDGKEGHDLISAGSGDDDVYGGSGNDILEGQDGHDWLEGGDGSDVLFGGAGNDRLKSNAGKGLLAGGRGDDDLYAGSLTTVIAFNKGDGKDMVYLNGSSPLTLSLGGGIRYEDIRIRRSGNDLFMDFNGSKNEYLKISGYYGLSTANRPAITLQMLTQASGAYNPSGTDRLRDNQVEIFDAGKLIKAFDTAYAANSGLRRGDAWAVMNNLLDAHLTGSNTAAKGGDLAYQFGSQTSANLAGMSMTSAGAVLSDASFASGMQTLNRPVSISAGPRLLG